MCSPLVAGRDARVLPKCQSGAGGLQAGHEDGRQHTERTLQTAPHPCHTRAGESRKVMDVEERVGMNNERETWDGVLGRKTDWKTTTKIN